MKRCPRCGETKPLEDFHRRTKSADGRQRFCKDCERVRVRDWMNGRASATRAKWAAIAAEAAAEA